MSFLNKTGIISIFLNYESVLMNLARENVPIITIDGPAGSGKGTISQSIATKLGWNLLDSGALYRLVGLAATIKGIALDDEAALSVIARDLDVSFKPGDSGIVDIILDNNLVTNDIRTEEAGASASKVAAVSGVRKALLERQRQFQTDPGLVADGRDMGTVVFPKAKIKIFLTASAEIRAERRLNQLKQQGINANLRGLIRDIEERDARDTNRKDAPLIPAEDAIIIDTSTMSIDEVVNTVMGAVEKVY
ncbi:MULTISPECIES: (d)CMP kinase [unclassified Cocleimonas]|uniref:(d)CMP kinase n=1 Tax=unclassified Cocleimonas TaxID=2639732 RepID=UPI002DB7C66B|nr:MULTISPECIES: (d)CMP kinase [unclassified Cocleimonas]